jgi:hypothetical protein
MSHELYFGREFFEKLVEFDARIAVQVAESGCPYCGGPLHRADYDRKPRGGRIAEAGEAFGRRFSLCCGRPGCRRRALPPSLRFLGRRVYLEVVILAACAYAAGVAAMRKAVAVPKRTLRRWCAWWVEEFPATRSWQSMRARFAPPPPAEAELPRSLLERLAAAMPDSPSPIAPAVLMLAARWLAPVTTRLADGSRFVRVG